MRSFAPRSRRGTRRCAAANRKSIFIGPASDPSTGRWVELPCDEQKITDAIEYAGSLIGAPRGAFDVIISDSEIPVVNEYDSPYQVNHLMRECENMDDDEFYALCSVCTDIDDMMDAIELGSYSIYDADNEYELGMELIREFGFDGIDLEMYFDYEAYGRDVAINDSVHFINGKAIALLE